MSKGFAYTSFAILSATLLISILFVQVYQPNDLGNANAERIGEASFFLDSLFKDTDRTLDIATRRAFAGGVSEIVNTGEPLESPQENITEIMVNGTLDGDTVDSIGNASLSEWETRVVDIASDSGYSLDVSVVNASFNSTGFDVVSSFEVKAELLDPVTRAGFNRTESVETTTSINDLEDPMITVRSRGRYTVTVNDCGFNSPADKVLTGTQNTTETGYGVAVVNPSDLASIGSKSDKIIAIQDPDDYSSDQLNDFEGAIASQTRSQTGSINTAYVFGTGSLSGIENGTKVLINSNDVWNTRFSRMFEDGCYIESEEGPEFADRLENNLSSDSNKGISTLIDVSKLPVELQKSDGSAVGFVYFDDSASPDTVTVKEVSSEYSWFRLDQEYIDRWGLEELAE